MGIDEDISWEDSSCEDRAGGSWENSSRANSRVNNRVSNREYSSMGSSSSNCMSSNCVDRECVSTEGRDPHSGLMHEQLTQLTQLVQAQEWELTGQHVMIAVVRKQLEEQQLKFERQMAGLEAEQLGWYIHQPHCRCMLCTLQLEQRERAQDCHGKTQQLPQPRGAAREQRSEQGGAQQQVQAEQQRVQQAEQQRVQQAEQQRVQQAEQQLQTEQDEQ